MNWCNVAAFSPNWCNAQFGPASHLAAQEEVERSEGEAASSRV